MLTSVASDNNKFVSVELGLSKSESVNWNQKAIVQIDSCKNACSLSFENQMDQFGITGHRHIQNKLDSMGRDFENFFESIGNTVVKGVKERLDNVLHTITVTFPEYVNSVKGGTEVIKEWSQSLSYKALCGLMSFLEVVVTLSSKAASNILRQLYQMIKLVPMAVVHPMETTAQLAKLIVNFVHSLTKPETWARLGAGMMGSGGAGVTLGNAFGFAAVVIGAIITTNAIAIGALMAAIKEEDKDARIAAALSYVLKTGDQIPESMLTGFIVGMIGGALERSISKHKQIDAYLKDPDYWDIEDAIELYAHDKGLGESPYLFWYDAETGEACFELWKDYQWTDHLKTVSEMNLGEYLTQLENPWNFRLMPASGVTAVAAGSLLATDQTKVK